MAGESKVAVVAALLGNLIIALLKLTTGLLARSSAMLAEAAHSFSDVGNQILLMVGLVRSKRAPSPQHPYGYGKSAYLWPLLVAILLFGVAGGYSLVEGISKIRDPHPIEDVTLALLVLGAAFIIEGAVLFIAVRGALRKARAAGARSLREFLRDNRDATLLTVIVEDTLALIGLPIAAGAMLLARYTGNGVWDGIGSVLIGILLMGFALFLGKEVHDLILGLGLSRRDLQRVHEILDKEPAIARVLSVQSLYLGPDVVLLGAEVDLDHDLTADEVEVALTRAEEALTAELPVLKYVYLDPTHAREAHAARVPSRGGHTRRTLGGGRL